MSSLTVQLCPRGQVTCTEVPFGAPSCAARPSPPLTANQGISRNDYNQPRYPESCPRALPGENTLFFYFMNEQACMLSINVCVNHW